MTFCLHFGPQFGRVPGGLSLPNSAKHWRQCITISCRVSAPTSPGEPHPTSCWSSLWLEGGRRMWEFIQIEFLFPGRFLTLVLVVHSDLHTWVVIAAWHQGGRRENCSKKKIIHFMGPSRVTLWHWELKDFPGEPLFPLCVSATIMNAAVFCSVKIQFICLAGRKAKTLPFLNWPEWKGIFKVDKELAAVKSVCWKVKPKKLHWTNTELHIFLVRLCVHGCDKEREKKDRSDTDYSV